MAAPEVYYLSAAWAIVSALAVGALGVFALFGGAARPRGAFAFGLFCVAWCLQILAGNAATLVWSSGLANLLYLSYIALLLVLPYFLLEFAASHGPASRTLTTARAAAVGVALLAAGILVLRPELIHGGVDLRGAHFYRVRGPLEMPLVQAPFFVALGVALVALQRAVESAPTARVGQRSTLLLAGLGVYAAHAAGTYATTFAAYPILGFVDAETVAWIALFGALALLAAALAWRNLALARAAPRAEERAVARVAGLALAIPLGLGVIEGVLVHTLLPEIQLVGLWRVVGVGIIAYGIARWRIYDLPQRAKRVAATTAGAGAAVATGAAAYGAGSLAAATPSVPILAGLLVLAAALVPSVSFARRLFGIQPRRIVDQEERLYGQRIDAYRAALEASLARDTLAEDEPFLAALRERFHITPDEHRLLMHLAQSSVIVARDRHAWDAYERLRLLGEGGGGRTWLARDRARDRLVVLKEPLERWQQEPTAREAVLREARLAAKVRHPNVVAVEEVLAGKGSPVIVMEYLEGGSLADLLRAKGALPWPQAKGLALDILRGVEAVHAGGIVHRDLKPSNILLSDEGVAKVADFGIAVASATGGDRTVILDPAASTIAGTFHYMAPEARAGAVPDRRADVYGCAAILHEMLYGAPPGLPSPTVVRHDLPAGVAAVLARGLAPSPEARYAGARAMADELAKLA